MTEQKWGARPEPRHPAFASKVARFGFYTSHLPQVWELFHFIVPLGRFDFLSELQRVMRFSAQMTLPLKEESTMPSAE